MRVPKSLLALAIAAPTLAAFAQAGAKPDTGSSRFPAPDCETRVGYDRDMMLPGYLISKAGGPAVCVPFTTTAAKPPTGYEGEDYYVDEFSDEKLRQRWAVCKADPECIKRVGKPIFGRQPPNREYRLTNARDLYLLGRIPDQADIDLNKVRRPAFFAASPYEEPVATLDAQTYTVEFTAPAEPHERIKRKRFDDVKLRGWYVRGDGIDDGKGGKVRALVVMNSGGGGRLTSIVHPNDQLYHIDPASGKTALNAYPNATTGSPGQRDWRKYIYLLNRAGFDVLSYDRRGVGVSSGFSDTNTLQQGRDILSVVANLGSGDGLRVLSPSGEQLSGLDAAKALAGRATPGRLPTLLLGNSRGTMSTGWAMTRNFDKSCDYDLEVISCGPAVGLKNIKGAILISEFSSGPGYVPNEMSANDDARGLGRDRGLFIAGNEVEHNLVFFPSSAILAGVSKWPAAFYARGLWDYAASLQGTIASYDRVKGLKELVVVRGPHPMETWPEQEWRRVSERLVAFARAAALGKTSVPGGRPWTTQKDLVATTDDLWEPTTKPAGR